MQTCQRAKLTEDHIRDELFILGSKGSTTAMDQQIAEGAAAVWAAVFAMVHNYPTERRLPTSSSRPALEGTWKASAKTPQITR